jgi:hypothetical protein
MEKNKKWIFPFLIVFSSILWGMDGVIFRPALYFLPVLQCFSGAFFGFSNHDSFLLSERKELKKISKKSFFYFFLTALFWWSDWHDLHYQRFYFCKLCYVYQLSS